MNYGPKLPTSRWEKETIALQHKAMSERTRRRLEMDLNIDHRLGVNYPVQKRSDLWLAHEAMDKKRLQLHNSFTLIKRLFPQFEWLQVLWLFRYGRKQLSYALSPEDLKTFLGE